MGSTPTAPTERIGVRAPATHSMQTFLPYPDFRESVACLDWRRLGKQRVEAKQILLTLQEGSRWQHHPAVRMWRGYERALQRYMNCCIQEWMRRGYRNNMKLARVAGRVKMPWWFGNAEFHASHRSNLLRKDVQWYGQFGWQESNDLPYIWPRNG